MRDSKIPERRNVLENFICGEAPFRSKIPVNFEVKIIKKDSQIDPHLLTTNIFHYSYIFSRQRVFYL